MIEWTGFEEPCAWLGHREADKLLTAALRLPADSPSGNRVAETLSRLPRQCSNAIQLKLVDGLSHEQCARNVGVTTSTFHCLFSYATQAFAREWDKT